MPSDEKERLETKPRKVSDNRMTNLVSLYCLAQKWEINDLMKAIDTIQDEYLEYGTGFG
jgi:hypothetical protein